MNLDACLILPVLAVLSLVLPLQGQEVNPIEPVPAARAQQVQTEEELSQAPALQLVAVYDESYPAPEHRDTTEVEIVVPADIGFPEVREMVQSGVEPLAASANLQVSSYEVDDYGPILKMQFDRETGRRLEAWARQHLGQRIGVMLDGQLLTAEPVNEGLGRRLLVALFQPLNNSEKLNWDGRSEQQVARDARDQQAFEYSLNLEENGQLDWSRRGISLAEVMDASLDGDVLSNRLLAWMALNSGAEEAQYQAIANLCWMAARDQHALWTRLIAQWSDQPSRPQLRAILILGQGEDDSGDAAWSSLEVNADEDLEPGEEAAVDASEDADRGTPLQLSPEELETEAGGSQSSLAPLN